MHMTQQVELQGPLCIHNTKTGVLLYKDCRFPVKGWCIRGRSVEFSTLLFFRDVICVCMWLCFTPMSLPFEPPFAAPHHHHNRPIDPSSLTRCLASQVPTPITPPRSPPTASSPLIARHPTVPISTFIAISIAPIYTPTSRAAICRSLLPLLHNPDAPVPK